MPGSPRPREPAGRPSPERAARQRYGRERALADALPVDRPPTERRAPRPLADDAEARLRALHDRAVAEGRAFYRDPASGLQVLTSAFLLRQGACCERGCRHCPYPGGGPEVGRADADGPSAGPGAAS